MGKQLKTRHRFGNSIENSLWNWITEHSKESGIPLSLLLDEAIGDLKKKTELNENKM